MKRQSNVIKVGSSYYALIPKRVANQLDIKKGDQIMIEVEKMKLENEIESNTLQQLLKQNQQLIEMLQNNKNGLFESYTLNQIVQGLKPLAII